MVVIQCGRTIKFNQGRKAMATIFEIIFLIAGLWIIITGKIPQGLFQFLFGKGIYEVTPTKARLWGLLLVSPLPIVITVDVILGLVMRGKALGGMVFFEFIYMVVILICSIVIARRIRRPEAAVDVIQTDAVPAAGVEIPDRMAQPENKTGSYGGRIAIIAGLAGLSCLALVMGFTVITSIITFFITGVKQSVSIGDIILYILPSIVIALLSIFGIFLLVKRLRRKP
jgi:hypothetical protein